MTSSDSIITAAAPAQAAPKRRRKAALAYINRTAAPGINDTAFKLLRRIVTLTRNGKQLCNYPDSQAFKELGMSRATTERSFRALVEAGYVTVSRGRNLAINAGRHIRTVELKVWEGLTNE